MISKPRLLTLAVSLGGLVLFGIMYANLRADDAQSVGPGYLVLSLPFVLGAVVSVLSMRKRTRIMLYWLTALIMGLTGALTLFTGIGIYNIVAVIVFLVAAWLENESGAPSRRRPGNITTNPRTLSRR